MEALTHTTVSHHPETLSDAAMKALIDEGTRFVVGYLSG